MTLIVDANVIGKLFLQEDDGSFCIKVRKVPQDLACFSVLSA